MSDHSIQGVERHCDVAIIGGSAAGLAAALQLGRQRRSVIVIDDGTPRNAPASHMHGYLGHEGIAPSALVALGQEEVRSYGGEVIAGRAHLVTRLGDERFRVDLVGAHAIVARRVLIAIGIVDELPPIDGLAPLWGRSVIHCPFCHGFEFRDRAIVQIVDHPLGLHTARLFRQLSQRLTLVLDDDVPAEPAELDALRAGGVTILVGRPQRLVTDEDGGLVALELTDRTRVDADVVAVLPRATVRIEPFAPLGLKAAAHPRGLGHIIERDPSGATGVTGLYAAGNVTDSSQQVSTAAADGSRVGATVSADLAEEDLRHGVRASANEADWDHRYSGEQLWSGNPNGTLVHEVTSLPVGRALDVGAGEGGDACWLADRGWAVTASDVSHRALDRVATEAARRGVTLKLLHADANALEPFPSAAFDLVSAQYASIPRTPDGRGVANVIGAVAPGGTLIVVSHALPPVRATVDPSVAARPFDPYAYVRVDDFAEVLRGDDEWEVEVHETRPRPPGASSHHVEDVVLRARRAQ
jgi:thioredoxin reductase/SAM-dependent methyltransferase